MPAAVMDWDWQLASASTKASIYYCFYFSAHAWPHRRYDGASQPATAKKQRNLADAHGIWLLPATVARIDALMLTYADTGFAG
jgi:hypothetical protein